MTVGPKFRPLTLAIYPTSRGFGWAALASPISPYDGGLFETPKDKNGVCLTKVGELLDRLNPEALVLEAFERSSSNRSERIARLGRALVALANDRGIEFVIYTRRDIEETFAEVGARTRYEIAQAVTRQLPALDPRLPPKRRPWQAEDRRMALFNAAAVVFTHYKFTARMLAADVMRR